MHTHFDTLIKDVIKQTEQSKFFNLSVIKHIPSIIGPKCAKQFHIIGK